MASKKGFFPKTLIASKELIKRVTMKHRWKDDALLGYGAYTKSLSSKPSLDIAI